jgi:hypothetical protein
MLTRFRMRMTRSGVAQLLFEDRTQAAVLPDGEVRISSATGDAERFQQLFNDTGTPEKDRDDEPSFGL